MGEEDEENAGSMRNDLTCFRLFPLRMSILPSLPPIATAFSFMPSGYDVTVTQLRLSKKKNY